LELTNEEYSKYFSLISIGNKNIMKYFFSNDLAKNKEAYFVLSSRLKKLGKKHLRKRSSFQTWVIFCRRFTENEALCRKGKKVCVVTRQRPFACKFSEFHEKNFCVKSSWIWQLWISQILAKLSYNTVEAAYCESDYIIRMITMSKSLSLVKYLTQSALGLGNSGSIWPH